jgi:hypothetical protein
LNLQANAIFYYNFTKALSSALSSDRGRRDRLSVSRLLFIHIQYLSTILLAALKVGNFRFIEISPTITLRAVDKLGEY